MTKRHESRRRIAEIGGWARQERTAEAGSMHWSHPADEWRGNLPTHSGRPHPSVQMRLSWVRQPGNLQRATKAAKADFPQLKRKATGVIRDASNRLDSARRVVGRNLEKAVNQNNDLVDITETQNILKNYLGDLDEYIRTDPNIDDEDLKQLQLAYESFSNVLTKPPFISAKKAQKMKTFV